MKGHPLEPAEGRGAWRGVGGAQIQSSLSSCPQGDRPRPGQEPSPGHSSCETGKGLVVKCAWEIVGYF